MNYRVHIISYDSYDSKFHFWFIGVKSLILTHAKFSNWHFSKTFLTTRWRKFKKNFAQINLYIKLSTFAQFHPFSLITLEVRFYAHISNYDRLSEASSDSVGRCGFLIWSWNGSVLITFEKFIFRTQFEIYGFFAVLKISCTDRWKFIFWWKIAYFEISSTWKITYGSP